MKYLLKTRIVSKQFIRGQEMRSSVWAARNRIDYPVRYIRAVRQAEPLLNKILVKLSPNELKQLPSQLGKAIVRVQDEKRIARQPTDFSISGVNNNLSLITTP